jgi:hypothetical protein
MVRCGLDSSRSRQGLVAYSCGAFWITDLNSIPAYNTDFLLPLLTELRTCLTLRDVLEILITASCHKLQALLEEAFRREGRHSTGNTAFQ